MGDSVGKSVAVVALATLIKQIESGDIIPEEMNVDFGIKEIIPEAHTGIIEFEDNKMRTFALMYRANRE